MESTLTATQGIEAIAFIVALTELSKDTLKRLGMDTELSKYIAIFFGVAYILLETYVPAQWVVVATGIKYGLIATGLYKTTTNIRKG